MFPTEKASQPALLDLSSPAPAPAAGKHDGQAPSREAPGEKHPRNQLNELTGQEWVYFTRSVLTTTYASAYGHQLRKAHGANKPPELMKEFIEFFTRADEVVLDPFAGVGGTLIGASITTPPRRAIGIEINPRWAETYREVIADSGSELTAQPLLIGDCREVLRDRERFADESVDYVLTDPPYNVHLPQTMSNAPRYRERHANRRTDYNMRSDAAGDLANLGSYADYLAAMQEVLGLCYRVLRSGRYLTLIIRNAYQDGRYTFTHAEVAQRAEQAGFVTKGEHVWYQAGTRLRPYGYPFSYVPNIAHQHIVTFRKPPRRNSPRRRSAHTAPARE